MIERPPTRLRSRSARWALLLAFTATRGSATALPPPTADDLCAPGVNPCLIQRTITLPGDVVLDFGTRDVVVTSNGALDAGSATLRLMARSLDVQARGALLAAGGLIAVTTTGDLTLERSADGKTRARVVVAADGGGGEIDLTAGGTLTIGGVLNARGTTPDADGGTLALVAAGDVVVTAAAGDVTVSSGSQGTGGQVSLQSTGGGVVVRHGIDASGGDGDGGDVEVTAAGDVDLDQLDVRGGGDAGCGGSVRVSAGGDVLLGGAILGSGASGATGAEVDVQAGGTLRVAAPIRTPGGAPDGDGGDVGLAGAVVDLEAPIAALGAAAGAGGDVSVGAGTDVTLAALVDASGGADGRAGSVSVDAPGSVTVATEIAADGDLGGIAIAAGRLLVTTGTVHASAAPDGLGGTVDLQGACDLQLGRDVAVTVAGRDAENRLGGGRPMRVAGTLTATARNLLLYEDPGFPPMVTGTLVPAPVEALAATLPSCGASTTTSTTTTSSSTVVVTVPATTTSSTTSTVTASSWVTSTEEPAVTTTTAATTTSATIATTTTSSTTLAAPSCGPADSCDDGVGCTRDECVDGRCVHDEAPGRPGALCRIMELASTLERPPSGALPHGVLARRLVRRATAAVRLVAAAGIPPGSRDRLRRAARQLAVLEHLVVRHEGTTIERGFAEHVRLLASEATARVTLVLAQAS